ncbi:MAG TPA: preprotein translocase subunit SecG [Candidatus Blautia faecavium]|uniref:Protein-export membrane protein SecG n=1 Tax=Candidatus Blautia faecavium TaxID=2838487 RepID=A0A9D2LRK0_9FIRM|nr:preprotein translocase subunit SecG [Candidatus Blautia faecavium]
MEILRIILTVIFAIDCIALTVVVLMQEGKQQGLGAIAGAADTYWGKNKGRSMEGGLVKATTIMGILFFVLAAVLNMNF